MKLVVTNYLQEEQHSLDCMLCPDDKQEHFTVCSFWDSTSGQAIVICPEHMDEMVRAALDRHREGLARNEPYWYLEEDDDPWEEDE